MTEKEAAAAVTGAKTRSRVEPAHVPLAMHLRLPNSSQRVTPPYSSTEVAMSIGISLDTFYRTRQTRHERDGLPAPISERGPLKWERTGFDAWLTRHHPMRPKTIDTFAPPPAGSDEEHRERLRTAYGHHGA
jgi:hypothetical protein